jgi:hypothetical protein
MEDIKKSIEQEAREAGRIDPDIKEASEPVKEYTPKRSGTAPTREDKENSIDTTINFDNLTPENIDDYIKTCPVDDKDNRIIPDDIFDLYYKILPEKCVNQSRSWRTTPTGGKIKIFGADPEADKEIQKKGAETLNAALAHRRSMSEDIQLMLTKKASNEAIRELNLTADANNQQAIIAAAILQAIQGNVKAQQFLRDTIGEQPTAKQDLNVSMTDEDRKLLDKVEARLNS